jgi:hypothetical protein
MRIQTIADSSHAHLDFGSRTFSTERVKLPATVGAWELTFSAHCHETSEVINVDIAFLTQGFVKVILPLNTIIQSAVEVVELAGFWLGPVE